LREIGEVQGWLPLLPFLPLREFENSALAGETSARNEGRSDGFFSLFAMAERSKEKQGISGPNLFSMMSPIVVVKSPELRISSTFSATLRCNSQNLAGKFA